MAAFAGLAAVSLLHRVEIAFALEAQISTELGRGVMSTVAGSLFSLMVLVSSAVLVAVQLASSQLTPRIVAQIYRDPFRKFALSSFAFTFTFAVGAMVRIENSVPLLTTYVASYGFLFNLALFLFFIDGIGKALRPSFVLRRLALNGRKVVQDVYPFELTAENSVRPPPLVIEETTLRVVTNDQDGVLIAFDDDWRTGNQEQEIIDTTIPPTNNKESAIVRDLAPGNYTAVVRGKNNTTGIAVVEVYALQ